MEDLSYLKTISIEIGSDCNLKNVHEVCPAAKLQRNEDLTLSSERICEIMDEAVNNGFDGLFAFHFYNEPLLYIGRINEIASKRPNYKYLLWSNGTLVKKLMNEGYDFNIFEQIIFTCYDEAYRDQLEELKKCHKDVRIFSPEMDDRLNIYEENEIKQFSCKKMIIELPIDCEGNVYICTFDYQKQYLLGNVRAGSLMDVMRSDLYDRYFLAHQKLLMSDDACELCKKCRRICRKIM